MSTSNLSSKLSVGVKYPAELTAFFQMLGIRPASVIRNPTYDELYSAELSGQLRGYDAGVLTESGAVSVDTGEFTGRSPKDKYIVMDEKTRETVWWPTDAFPNSNHPLQPEVWEDLKAKSAAGLSDKPLYVVDAFCGASETRRLCVRFVMEVAWQAHFVTNMFIRPSKEELVNFEPDFVVLNASKIVNSDWRGQGLNSENFVAFNLSQNMQLIGGTWYGGEMKKGLFSVMNYYLPLHGLAAMHASANKGLGGDVAIFFGLSGTGKTTLSADPKRELIGDDELGWDDDGVFNLEGGCYAKTINLSQQNEPDIFNAIRRDALLENVVVSTDGVIDYADDSKTQNTRVSYPIYHISNCVQPVSRGGHAKIIVFLTADAFGVFPPVSKLTDSQAQYHFLSGFTSKVAGTELGVDEPSPTFSSCFGEAFLTLHPTQYAEQLVKRMHANGTRAYLVNTGWNGRGQRISLPDTRAIIDSIMDGSIEEAPSETLPLFGLEFPTALQHQTLGADLLDPRKSHASGQWWLRAEKLAGLFQQNFEKYTSMPEGKRLEKEGPKLS